MARTDSDISNYWKEYYQKLGNIQDQKFCDVLNNHLDRMVEEEDMRKRTSWWHFVINAEECRKAFLQLKNNNASDLDGIQAERIKNGSLNLYRHIAGLFTGLVKHGCIPRNFRETAIIPILKY